MNTENNKIYDIYKSENSLTMNYDVWNVGHNDDIEIDKNEVFANEQEAIKHSKNCLKEYDENYDWWSHIHEEIVDNIDIEPHTHNIEKKNEVIKKSVDEIIKNPRNKYYTENEFGDIDLDKVNSRLIQLGLPRFCKVHSEIQKKDKFRQVVYYLTDKEPIAEKDINETK